jgi:hypothetical protein
MSASFPMYRAGGVPVRTNWAPVVLFYGVPTVGAILVAKLLGASTGMAIGIGLLAVVGVALLVTQMMKGFQ